MPGANSTKMAGETPLKPASPKGTNVSRLHSVKLFAWLAENAEYMRYFCFLYVEKTIYSREYEN